MHDVGDSPDQDDTRATRVLRTQADLTLKEIESWS